VADLERWGNEKMKKRLKLFWGVLAVTVLAGGGFCMGQLVALQKNTVVMANFSIAQSVVAMTALDNLDKGNIDAVRKHLNHQIDSDILTFAPLINWNSPGTKRAWAINDMFAIKALKKRAKQIKEADIKKDDNEATKFISEFLEQAEAYSGPLKTPQQSIPSNPHSPSAQGADGR
jgi:choline-glycine betaine transporter